MKYTLVVLAMLSTFLGKAQVDQDTATQVTTIQPDSIIEQYKKIMIVPFEEHMYISGIQPYLAATSGKTHIEILNHFRYQIAKEMQNQFLYLYNTASLIHMNDTTKDLYRTYNSIGYEFIEMEVEDDQEETSDNPIDIAKNLFKPKKQQQKTERGSVQNGQIVSTRSNNLKVATVKVKDKTTFQYLSEKYGADLFVFITQLDIETDISDQFAVSSGEAERFLRAHYSVVDKNGEVIDKGVVWTKFPGNVNDINQISSTYFPILAQKLAARLPQPAQPQAEEKKAVNALEKVKNKKGSH